LHKGENMIHYFYYLYFGYEIGKDKEGKVMKNILEIGFFSSKAKAEEQIHTHKDLPGFRDHPVDCFRIEKHGVRFLSKINDKSLIDLHVLFQEYFDGEFDHITFHQPYADIEDTAKCNPNDK